MIKGIAASDGYGIGRAVVIKDSCLDYSQVVYSGAQRENERLTDAVNRAIEKTSAMAESIRQALGAGAKGNEGEILEGQIAMLRDPFMVSQMKEAIDGGQVAEAAVDSVCNMFVEMFKSTGDEIMMQRATDVEDLRTRVLKLLLNIDEVDIANLPQGTVLVAKDLTPSMTARLNKQSVVGVLTELGGRTSHSAILSRALEIPAVLGAEGVSELLAGGEMVIVDGFTGEAIVNPSKSQLEKYSEKQAAFLKSKSELKGFVGKPTVTKDGKKLELYCNIGKPGDVTAVTENDGEGVGLFRTEFLFMDRTTVPDEEEQFEAYKSVAEAMNGREVIIRTLDIGGDKEIPYLGLEKEENPFLGFRAVRYCLKNTDLYRTQLRAIIRAAAYGNIKIMVPLVTVVEEIRSVKKLCHEIMSELDKSGIPYNKNIKIGVMIETPSAALTADLLSEEADFFSIGTNDLTGYTMAVDRGNTDVASLYNHFNPAVLRAIKHTIECAKRAGIPVGMCGEAAADKYMIPLLVAFGLDEFSVTPTSVLGVRRALSETDRAAAEEIAEKVMSLKTADEIIYYLQSEIK